MDKKREKLKKVRKGLMIYIAAVGLPWLFLDVPYDLFTAAALLPFPAVILLLALFPEDTTLSEDPKVSTRVELLAPMFFSVIAPGLRMFDSNFLTLKPLFLWTAGLTPIVVGILWVRCREIRTQVLTFLAAAVLSLLFCFTATAHLNYLLDSGDIRDLPVVVTDMYVINPSKGPDRYVLTVVGEERFQTDLAVSRKDYEALQVGQTISIQISDGGLGIPYAWMVPNFN